MKYETYIDTVALQVDFSNAEEQRNKLSLLCKWIIARELGLLKSDNNLSYIVKYDVYFGGTILFRIHSGFTTRRDKLIGIFLKQYYLRIRFAGLKSHNQKKDEYSLNAFMTICAWLNTSRTKFRIVELDVAIDVSCRFDNVLAVCINKSCKTIYNEAGYMQSYKGTPSSYIEKYNHKFEANNAVVRAYLYNKSVKEELLGSCITRFELKLQNRFFLRYGFSAESIIFALDKYYVLYFESIEKKVQKIKRYNSYYRITAKEINSLRLDNYRLHANKNVIKEFIRQVQSVYVDFYWNIVLPVLSPRIS